MINQLLLLNIVFLFLYEKTILYMQTGVCSSDVSAVGFDYNT